MSYLNKIVEENNHILIAELGINHATEVWQLQNK